MRRALAFVGLVAVGVLACTTGAQAAVIVNTSEPINTTAFVPCANGGLGEIVDLSGNLHHLVTYTVNDNSVSGTEQFQPQGVHGVGETSGSAFIGAGVTRNDFASGLSNGRYEMTFVNNFRIIGLGGAASYRVHENSHVTITPDGVVTATVDNLTVDCD